MRWTIDYPEDLRFAQAVYDRLYDGGVFHSEQIYALLKRFPEIGRINAAIGRGLAYARQVAQEGES
jgi:spore coat polysaccharide biosynthesis protein SpsF (cytidylyltransferase family)